MVKKRRRCTHLADVCDILSLRYLSVAVEVLPEVGDREHAVGALYRGSERFLVV